MGKWTALAVMAAAAAGFGGLGGCADSPTASSLDKPSRHALRLDCNASTDTTITLLVRAGADGAPAGFTVQWMTRTDLKAGAHWDSAFSAQFSGIVNDSLYNLDDGETVLVTLGIAQSDSGATGDSTALACGTEYVFRAYVTDTAGVRVYSESESCMTGACDGDTVTTLCTKGMGYYKNHPDAWMLDSLAIGNHTYTQTQLMQILWTPPRGNHLIIFARHVIVAHLNRARVEDTTSIVTNALDSADALIGDLMIPPIGDDSMRFSRRTNDIVTILERYNEGEYTDDDCDDEDDDDNGGQQDDGDDDDGDDDDDD